MPAVTTCSAEIFAEQSPTRCAQHGFTGALHLCSLWSCLGDFDYATTQSGEKKNAVEIERRTPFFYTVGNFDTVRYGRTPYKSSHIQAAGRF